MPAWVIPLIMAASAGASATGSAISARNQNRTQQQMTKEQLDAERAMHALELAYKESTANPFRHQMMQGASLSALDELERGQYTPAKLDVSGSPYASYVPKQTGGYSYQKSPELVNAAAALKKDVLAGNRAPSVIPSWQRTTAPVPGTPNATQQLPPANQELAILDLLSLLYPNDPIAQARKPTKPGGGGSFSIDTFTNRVVSRKPKAA